MCEGGGQKDFYPLTGRVTWSPSWLHAAQNARCAQQTSANDNNSKEHSASEARARTARVTTPEAPGDHHGPGALGA